MLLTLSLCLLQARDRADAPPAELSTALSAPAGVRVSVWSPPGALNAARSLDADLAGRVWVLEHSSETRLVVLEDGDADGTAEKQRVALALPDTRSAGTIAVLGERVHATLDGQLVEFRDADGDGVFEGAQAIWEHQDSRDVSGAFASSPNARLWLARTAPAHGLIDGAYDSAPQARLQLPWGAPRELAFDSFGNLFASFERAVHVLVPGADGKAASAGALVLDSGDPRGLVAYESAFVPGLEGCVLVADASGRVLRLAPRPSGAGITFETSTLLAAPAEGPGADFRPVDIAVGSDGAVFVLDAAASGARVLRVSAAGGRIALPRMSLTVTNGQIAALLNPAPNLRARAFELLAPQCDALLKQLQGMLTPRYPRWQARVTWLLARGGAEARAKLREQLSSEHENARLVALRALASVDEPAAELARRFVGDPALALRAEALRCLAKTPWEAKRELVLRLSAPWPADDAVFLEALACACGADASALLAALDVELAKPDASLNAAARAQIAARFARGSTSK
jgi:hypothetical protein